MVLLLEAIPIMIPILPFLLRFVCDKIIMDTPFPLNLASSSSLVISHVQYTISGHVLCPSFCRRLVLISCSELPFLFRNISKTVTYIALQLRLMDRRRIAPGSHLKHCQYHCSIWFGNVFSVPLGWIFWLLVVAFLSLFLSFSSYYIYACCGFYLFIAL